VNLPSESLRKTTIALRIQARVVGALVLREIKTRYGRQRLGYLWAVIEPIIFVAILAVLFSVRGRGQAWGMPVVSFLITGIIPYMLFRDLMSVGLQAVRTNKALLTFPQVKIFDLLLARALLETATHILVFVLLIVVAVNLIDPLRIEEPLLVFVWLMFVALFGFGLGIGLGTLAALFPVIEQLAPTLISRPMFFISGVFFTVELMPEDIRGIALFNPLLHMIELLRSAFFSSYESIYASPMYTIIFTMGVLSFGLLTLSALRKQILCAPRN
jgi:capsular polysaccharide transport system permease protein